MSTINQPDAIIVGSGAGGATAARALTQRGLSVVVLERGGASNAEDFIPLDELHFLDHKALIPPRQTDPMLYQDLSKPGSAPTHEERWWITNMVGGSTNQWEANLPRYTEPDFAVTRYLKEMPGDVSMVDWPWSYHDFQPYFERAEWDWGVSGAANQSPAQEPTRAGYEYPMPPIREHASSPFLRFVFNKAGMFPYRSPRGINSRTYDGRPGCPFCGFCQGFGCASNCRSGAGDTVLRKAVASGRCDLRTGHNVLRLLFEPADIEAGHRITGVEYVTEPGGTPRVLKASIVIVSIQAIESARLLLNSAVPNENGLIGRYLTYHTKGDLEFTFPNQRAWGSMDPSYPFQPGTSLGSLQLRDLYVINDPNATITKGGKFSIYDPITINPPLKAIYRTGLGSAKPNRLWGKALQSRLIELRENGGVSFSFTGETMSMYDNRVELADGKAGRPRVLDPYGQPVALTYYQHHAYDLALSKYALDRVASIMTDAGGVLRVNRPQGISNPGYGHNHGTLRAGRERDASVLDPDCQAHQVRGLYVLDAAFMPTAGASNPSLTVIANAYRVCDRINPTGS